MQKPGAWRKAQRWRGGPFLRSPLTAVGNRLSTGAFSSHPSSRIPWTMLLGVQWLSGSVNTEPKNMDGVLPSQSGDCGNKQSPELPCQVLDTCYCQKQSQLWWLGSLMFASLPWPKDPFQPLYRSRPSNIYGRFTGLQLTGIYLYHLRLETEKPK